MKGKLAAALMAAAAMTGSALAQSAGPSDDPAAARFEPFVLRSVAVKGSSVSPERLAAAYGPFLGRTLDAEGLEALTDAVAAAEAEAGVALYNVVVPDQAVGDGALRLEVLEGHVEALQIVGDRPADMRLVQGYADKLQAERPLRRRRLERYTSLIRDISGLNAELDLKPGGAPGAVVLTIDPEYRRFQAGAAMTNRGAALLGRTQVEVDLFANGLWRQGDQTRLAFATATDVDRFQYYVASHAQPLNTEGTVLMVSAGHLRTKPAVIGLRGEATTGAVQFTHPLVRGYVHNLSLFASVDGVDSENAFLGLTLSNDRVRAARAGAAYSRTGEKTFASLSLTLSRGLNGLGAFTPDPAGTDLEFVKAQASAAFNRSLSDRWVVRTSFAAQWTNDRLPASEFVSYGGEEFGRRFETEAAVGDRGYAGSVEVAYLPQALPPLWKGSEVYAFADAGKVWSRSRPGAPPLSESLSSAGAGVRLVAASRISLEVEAATAVGPPPPGQGRDWRATFTLKTVI